MGSKRRCIIMEAKEKVIKIAIGEDGYLEKSKEAYYADHSILDKKTDGAGKDNYTKYARDLAKIGYFNGSKQGVDWCAVFVSWCMYQAFGKETALALQCQPHEDNCGAGCSSAAKYYKSKNRFYYDPEPGDQIFFKSSSGSGYGHTGIVEKVADGKVYTVEGNTGMGSAVISNGGGVRRKSYSLNNARIGGYGRPDWSLAKDNSNTDADTSQKEEGESMVELVEYNAVVKADRGKTVNLRRTASVNAAVVALVPVGGNIIVMSHENDEWARVSYMQENGIGINGYMMRKFIERIPDGTDDVEDYVKLGRNEAAALRARLSELIAELDSILGEAVG